MTMHNPPHPGEFIRDVYLEPFGISSRQLASSLGVAPSTLSRLLKGDSGISPEMALRLSKVLGRTREPILAAKDQDREGYVPNVVYSCGAIRHGETLFLPYGIADSSVGFAFVAIKDLLAAMV